MGTREGHRAAWRCFSGAGWGGGGAVPGRAKKGAATFAWEWEGGCRKDPGLGPLPPSSHKLVLSVEHSDRMGAVSKCGVGSWWCGQ